MRRRALTALVLPASLALALASTITPAMAANPPGNNGTIKVDAKVFDVLPDNESHPGCVFQVDFYGFDADTEDTTLNAHATFTVISPSVSTDLVVFTSPDLPIGGDSNAGGGSVAGIDQEVEFDLNKYLYQYMSGNQGAHVRLTVHADGATNADTKFKTFWVSGCTKPVEPPIDEDPTGTDN